MRVRAKSSPTWRILGLGLFTFATLIWLVFGMLSERGAEAQMGVPGGLFSRLIPNYGSDNLGEVFRTLRLTILRELTGDSMEQQLLRPVPTATWRDFAGAAPFTATPTSTATSTNTPTPTATYTPTPTHTATPRPTRTRTPTVKPDDPPPPPPPPTITLTPSITPSPTNSPTPIVESIAPAILLDALIGTETGPSCTFEINFDVEDAKPSAGISDGSVHLFYTYPLATSEKPASLSGGGDWDFGVPAERWFGSYSGNVSGIGTNDKFTFRVEVTDKAGNEGNAGGFTYNVDENCVALET